MNQQALKTEDKVKVNTHADERIRERLSGIVGCPCPDELIRIARAYIESCSFDTSMALRVAKLNGWYGDTRHYHPERNSNGDEVWIVARRHRMVTVMLRRSTQPRRCTSFDVNRVVDLVGTPKIFDQTAVIVWRQKS